MRHTRMRHTRPGDAATHDHGFVAPLFVEAGVTLANVHSNDKPPLCGWYMIYHPLVRGEKPYVRNP